MNEIDLASEPNQELVELYERGALEHRQATELGNPKTGNKAHDQLAPVYRELR